MTATIEQPAGATPPADDRVLGLEDLSVRFGGVAALEGVTFDVHAGEILGVIGPNGAGKTTLLNVISGFVRPSRGEVRLGQRRTAPPAGARPCPPRCRPHLPDPPALRGHDGA